MQNRPEKPRPDFPLFPHRNGQWCKKIKGKFVYFGPWNDPQSAEKRYKATLSDSLGEAARRFLEYQEEREEIGDIGYQHRMDLTRALDKLKEVVGEYKKVAQINAKDWGRWRKALNSTNEVVTQRNVIIRIQAFLNWCVGQRIIEKKPTTLYLNKPSRKDMRLARASQGERMFKPEEINGLLQFSGANMTAMILLGINAGLGPNRLRLDGNKAHKGRMARIPTKQDRRQA